MADEIRSELTVEGGSAFTRELDAIEKGIADLAASQKNLATASKDTSKAFADLNKFQIKAQQGFEALAKSAQISENAVISASLKGLRTAQKEALKTEAALKKAFRTQEPGTPIPAQRIGRFFDADGATRDLGRFSAEADAAFARINRAQRTSQNEARVTERRLRDAFRAPKAEAEALSNSLGRIGALASRFAIVGGLFALQAALRNSVTEAVEFEVSLAEIQTISGTANQDLGVLADQVRRISDEFGAPLEQVSEGVYQTLSNQVTSAGEAFNFLESAQKFAIGSVTSTDAAVNLLSSAINSFNLSASDADEISGKFFKTIELGRVRAEDLANIFGRVGDLSGQLGISLDETLASIATLTQTGIKANEAITLITNAELKLLKPTEALQEVFDKLGITTAEAGIQAFGFQGLLQKVVETSGGASDEIAELFGRVRAIRGVLGLATDRAEEFQRVLAEIKDAGAETIEAASLRVLETSGKRVEIAANQIRNAFVAGFGRAAVGSLDAVLSKFDNATDALNFFGGLLLATVGAWKAYQIAGVAATAQVEAGIIANATALGTLKTTLATLGRFLPTAIIGAEIGLIISQVESIDDAFKRLQDQLHARVDETTKREKEQIKALRDAQKEAEDKAVSAAQRFFAERAALQVKDAQQALRLQNIVLSDLLAQASSKTSIFEDILKGIRDSGAEARKEFRKAQDEIRDSRDELEQFDFDISLEGADDLTKSFKLVEQSQLKAREANEALSRGDKDRADQLNAISKSYADQAVSAARASANQAQFTKAVDQARQARVQAVRIDEEQPKLISERLKLEEKIGPALERNLAKQKVVNQVLADTTKILDEQGKITRTPAELEDARQLRIAATKQLSILQEQAKKLALPLAKFDVDIGDLLASINSQVSTAQGRIDLTPAIEIQVDQILSEFSRQVRSLTPEQLLGAERLSGIQIGPNTDVRDITKGIDDQKKARETATVAERDAKDSTAAFQKALIDSDKSLAQFDHTLRESSIGFNLFGDSQNTIIRNLRTLSSLQDRLTSFLTDQPIGNLSESQQRVLNQFQDIRNRFRDVIEATTFDPAAFSGINTELNKLSDGLGESFPALRKLVDEFIVAAGKARDAKAQLEGLGNAGANLTELNVKVVEGGKVFDDTAESAGDLKEATVTGAAAGKSAVDLEIDAWLRREKAIRDNIAAQQRLSETPTGGAVPGAFFGSQPLFRAGGGGVFRPRGQDRFLTVTSPGEGILSARAMRDFFPQVQAINTGSQPSFRNQGGQVLTQPGPINITINEAANPRETVREVMAAINRQSRLKTAKLRR